MTTLQPRESPSRTANGVAFVSSLQPSSRKPSPVLPPKTRPTEEEEEVSDDVSSNDEAPHAEPVSTSGRKRAHPPAELDIDGSPAPNKRLHTPTERDMQEKQLLYKKVAEAEKYPFMHRQILNFPAYLPFTNHAAKCGFPSPLGYSMLQSPPKLPVASAGGGVAQLHLGSTDTTLSTGGVANVVMPPTPASAGTNPPSVGTPASVGAILTPPRQPYPSQLYAPFMKYPFSPPTPSSIGSLGLLSPWNPGNGVAGFSAAVTATNRTGGGASGSAPATSTPRDAESNVGAETAAGSKPREDPPPKKGPVQTLPAGVLSPAPAPAVWQNPALFQAHCATGMASAMGLPGPASLPHLSVSPRPGFQPVQSPLSYFAHSSPLSPMMFIHSPYASSVSSCPSVSSSSGCSSDGGAREPARGKRYATSEYHVGPMRPLSVKYAEEDNLSEGPSNSGRNTPVDSSSDDSTVFHSSKAQPGGAVLSTGSAPYTPLSSGVQQAVVAQPPREVASELVGRGAAVSGVPAEPSPYPFSVEPLSCGQPSSVGSNSQIYVHRAVGSVERPSSGVSSMSSSLSSRDSTPEPDHDHLARQDQLKMEGFHAPSSDVFCLVPGRLSLLSSTQKYKVSVDEVRRRLSHPECLNASVLGGILRRAKSKNGGHVLRQRLESIGVSLPPGRRKATELSLLTSLVEGESLHLASDFRRLCDNFFPQSELAQIIARQHAGTPQAQDRISMVKASQLIVSELQAMLNAVGSPSNIQPTDPNNPYPGLTNFDLLTHGFGNPAINASLGVVQTYLQELLSIYEGRKPIQSESRFLVPGEQLAPPPHLPPPSSSSLARAAFQPGPGSDSLHPSGHQLHDGGHLMPTMKQELIDSPSSCAL